MFKGIMVGFVSIIVVILGFFFYQNQPDNDFERSFNSLILAFDYDGRHGSVTARQLVDGDGYIFLKMLPDNKNYFLSTLNELQGPDDGNKEYIALDNAYFNDLYVGRYFNANATIQYQLLRKSGIAGIIFEYDNYREIKSAVVILTDNSRRKINIVPINDNFLLAAKLISSTVSS